MPLLSLRSHRSLPAGRLLRAWICRATLLAATAACGGLPAPRATGPVSDLDYLRQRRLMVPVDGIKPADVPDSYSARRNGGRAHRAIDIRARKGTPVLAADAGTVRRVGENTNGGKTVYVVEPGGRFIYYYAHLDDYRRGIRQGDRVEKGDVIGYVGATGNAPKNLPHLHFQVMRLVDPKRYWDGTPVDARPYLVERGRAKDR